MTEKNKMARLFNWGKIPAFTLGVIGGALGTAAYIKSDLPKTQKEAIETREQVEPVKPEAPKEAPMGISSVERTNLNGDRLPDLLIRHNNGMITQYHGEKATTARRTPTTYTFSLVGSDLPVEFRPMDKLEEGIRAVNMPVWAEGYHSDPGTMRESNGERIAKSVILPTIYIQPKNMSQSLPSGINDNITFVFGKDESYSPLSELNGAMGEFISSYNGTVKSEKDLNRARSVNDVHKERLEEIVGPFDIDFSNAPKYDDDVRNTLTDK
ncbi:hypothetical protein HOG54_01870 [Candidatus Woesearchaeota archaeon]|jgi:hypothetical protein|nr:hypothetical protein [Candidatus Woesearchaeota archaeon]